MQVKSWWDGCPNSKEVSDFNLTRYLGTWYGSRRSQSVTDFESGDCGQAQYSIRDDGFIRVINSEQRYKDGKMVAERLILKAKPKEETQILMKEDFKSNSQNGNQFMATMIFSTLTMIPIPSFTHAAAAYLV